MATATEAAPINLKVYNVEGEQVGSVDVDRSELAGGKINKQLMHDAVLMYLANQRAGTHSTKRRGEVAGSTKKLFRQKGTGRARVGNRRTNKRVGGGTAKGPKPRDYEYHMPKKAVRASTRMALLSKFEDKETVVLESLNLPEVGTGYMVEVLDNLELEKATCLIGLGQEDIDEDKTIYLSARNIPYAEVMPVSQFNTYCILRPSRLILTKSALEELCQNLTWKSLDESPMDDDEDENDDDSEADD